MKTYKPKSIMPTSKRECTFINLLMLVLTYLLSVRLLNSVIVTLNPQIVINDVTLNYPITTV